MTISSTMLAVCTPPDQVRDDIGCFADVTALYSDERPFAVSLSRGLSAGLHLDRLLGAYQAEPLYRPREPVIVLGPDAIAPTISGLEQLFARIAAEPARAVACAHWECTAEQIVASASGSELTPVPEDPRDEEGESLQHVIGYLKSLTFVLRHARSQGFAVVHGQSHALDGTEN